MSTVDNNAGVGFLSFNLDGAKRFYSDTASALSHVSHLTGKTPNVVKGQVLVNNVPVGAVVSIGMAMEFYKD